MKFIPVNEPVLDGNEKKYLNECIDTGWISSEGKFVDRLESEFAAKVNRKYGIAVCNGSAALEAAIIAIEIKPGDEVILPAFTIISCASAIVRAGGIPVPIDCRLDDKNIDCTLIESYITPKTKAIIAVHIYGLPCDMDSIENIARKHNLKIIEDAAQMHGQTYKGKPCGSFGDVSCFSFYPNKLVTSGEGGIVLTDCEETAERLKSLRNLCFNTERRFKHYDLGWNFRMSNLQAAVGTAQLERLNEFVKIKRKNGNLYQDLLADCDKITLPMKANENAENIYWVFDIVLKDNAGMNAEKAMNLMKNHGIGSRPFFYPMHLQPVFINMGLFYNMNLPNSEYIAEYGFYLPSGLALKEEEIIYTVEKLKEILK